MLICEGPLHLRNVYQKTLNKVLKRVSTEVRLRTFLLATDFGFVS